MPTPPPPPTPTITTTHQSSVLKHMMVFMLTAALLTFTACKKSDDAAAVKSDTQNTTQTDTPPTKDKDTAKTNATISTDYPLTTCVISKKKLDDHGEPYIHNHNGTEVRFCCEPCVDDFNKDPDKYIATILAAKAAKADK